MRTQTLGLQGSRRTLAGARCSTSGDPGVDLGGKVTYVAVPLGGQATDLNGRPLGDGPSTIKPIGDLQKGLPSGTRVVVVTDLFPDANYGEKHLNADAGTEPGTPLLRGISPHNFSVEDGVTRHLSG